MTRAEYESKLAEIYARIDAELAKPASERVNTCALMAEKHELGEIWAGVLMGEAVEKECGVTQ